MAKAASLPPQLSATDKLRRTMMITPGNRADRIRKSTELAVDAVVLDLEDGVSPRDKSDARERIAGALDTLDFGHRERLVRINSIGSNDYYRDIEGISFANVDALFVPKVEFAAQLQELDGVLARAEAALDYERTIDVVATIETPRGLLNALAIADASKRTSALFFGSGDYAAATGGAVTARAFEFPKAMVVAAASAANMQAIDAAYFTAVKDAEATRADAKLGRELGFDGKLIFHPNQIAPCNEVFSPGADEITKARKIVDAHAAAQASGDGVAYVDGTFLAIDIVLMAERLLRKAALIEVRG